MKALRNKRILITGASSGIGEATALALATHNPQMLLVARNHARLRTVLEKIKTGFPECPEPVIISCDVTNDRDVRKMIKTCQYRFEGLDVLINNAGLGVYGNSENTALEDFRHVMETNFYGQLRCIYGFLPMMQRQNFGHIINIASVAAGYGVPYLAAYSASKAAFAAVNQSLRSELYGKNIEISIIYPGYTDTGFFNSEKKVGSAVRPEGPYMPAMHVAQAIVNTIIKGHGDLVLSREGKLLFALRDLFPGIVNHVMKKIAIRLQS